MAKKKAAKSAGKSASKSSKSSKSSSKTKVASKPKARAKKSRAASSPMSPKKVHTGSGPSAREIGSDLVRLCNMGNLSEPVKKWYHRNIDSIEADGQLWLGLKGIEAKNAWWTQTFEMHSFAAEGPYVGATGFAVKFTMSVTNRMTGERTDMSEVGVYTVKNGKIVREEFMYQ